MGYTMLVSMHSNPSENLAIEEWLFDQIAPSQTILLLYRNSQSIICGTFQNPWLECDVDWMAAKAWPVLRRISGGGTVWHDPGNLNISWLGPRQGFNRTQLLLQIQNVLRGIGISAEINERGDILHEGLKISGNALCYRSDRVLHHATLLINADLIDLRRALRPERGKWQILQSQGVRSQPASVTRLVDILPTIDPIDLISRIEHGLRSTYNVVSQEIHAPESDEHFQTILKKTLSWDWNFGRTPTFRIKRELSKPELLSAEWEVSHGLIQEGQTSRIFPGFSGMEKVD